MKQSLGEILVKNAALTASQLKLARWGAESADIQLGRYLVDNELVRTADVARALAEQSGREYVPPELLRRDLDLLDQLPLEMLKALRAMPIKGPQACTFVVADPNDLNIAILLEQRLGQIAHLVTSDEDVIDDLLSGAPNARVRRHTLTIFDKREERRVECVNEILCDYAFADSTGESIFTTIFAGLLRDLSLEGGRISGRLPDTAEERERLLDEDVEIICLLTTPELAGEEPIQVKGHVRWVKPDADDESHGELGAHWVPSKRWDASCLKTLLVREHQAEAQAKHESERDAQL